MNDEVKTICSYFIVHRPSLIVKSRACYRSRY
ncbi:MAG: hypothetical protein QOE33_1804 [Acidobacteriota bacterium]|nr:hypothetical protein [Acidobacteriota bacterium]